MATLKEEISRRRTFAIISHPDAGKTTLTEKFLLYGGAKHKRRKVSNEVREGNSKQCSLHHHLHRLDNM